MFKLKNNPWKIAGIVIVLFLAAAGAYYVWGMPAPTAEAAPLQTAKARTGDLSIVISGAGNLVAASRVDLGFRTGGTVMAVDTQVGQTVSEGQVLVKLDDSAARLQLATKELALQALISSDALNEAEIARLNAQDTLSTAITTLQYLISPTVYTSELTLAKMQTALDEKKTANAPAAEITIAENNVKRAQSVLDGALYTYRAEYILVTFPYTYKDLTTNETIETVIPPSAGDISLARAKVRTAELALADANGYFERLSSKDTCADLSALGTLTSKLSQACLDVKTAQLTVDGANLIAPNAGMVADLTVAVGQSVGTAPVVTISTNDKYMHFYVEETDLSQLKIGLPIKVIFDAYPEQEFKGSIERIDPELASIDGSPAVSAWATLDTSSAGGFFLSGMTADVEVVAGEAKSTVLVPAQALRELAAGSYAVFSVQADNSLKLTPVTIGLRDLANVQILSGLKAGDIVSTGVVETK
ncbi:MAG: efflux RND transporter periplasmic adaptor subunit [Chloroflexi bacterium]|nr:efflux RND transporter periplasmic adaptor subunit [Chloroflexota bacterium]